MEEKICTRCGIQKQRTLEFFPTSPNNKDGLNSWCRECYRIRANTWYQQNKEHGQQTRALYYKENTEETKARSKKWQQDNKTRVNELSSIRYHKNPEPILKWQAAYRAANPEKERLRHAKYTKENPDKRVVIQSRRRARKLSLPDTWTHEQRDFMRMYWHFSCAVCGNQEGFFWFLADDHWIPIASPDCPGTIAENMIPLCHGEGGCNNSKHKSMPHEWLLKRYGKNKTAKIEKAIAVYFNIIRTQNPRP